MPITGIPDLLVALFLLPLRSSTISNALTTPQGRKFFFFSISLIFTLAWPTYRRLIIGFHHFTTGLNRAVLYGYPVGENLGCARFWKEKNPWKNLIDEEYYRWRECEGYALGRDLLEWPAWVVGQMVWSWVGWKEIWVLFGILWLGFVCLPRLFDTLFQPILAAITPPISFLYHNRHIPFLVLASPFRIFHRALKAFVDFNALPLSRRIYDLFGSPYGRRNVLKFVDFIGTSSPLIPISVAYVLLWIGNAIASVFIVVVGVIWVPFAEFWGVDIFWTEHGGGWGEEVESTEGDLEWLRRLVEEWMCGGGDWNGGDDEYDDAEDDVEEYSDEDDDKDGDEDDDRSFEPSHLLSPSFPSSPARRAGRNRGDHGDNTSGVSASPHLWPMSMGSRAAIDSRRFMISTDGVLRLVEYMDPRRYIMTEENGLVRPWMCGALSVDSSSEETVTSKPALPTHVRELADALAVAAFPADQLPEEPEIVITAASPIHSTAEEEDMLPMPGAFHPRTSTQQPIDPQTNTLEGEDEDDSDLDSSDGMPETDHVYDIIIDQISGGVGARNLTHFSRVPHAGDNAVTDEIVAGDVGEVRYPDPSDPGSRGGGHHGSGVGNVPSNAPRRRRAWGGNAFVRGEKCNPRPFVVRNDRYEFEEDVGYILGEERRVVAEGLDRLFRLRLI